MAYFTQNDFERLDYRLLQNSFVALYFRPQFLAEDISKLKKLGYSVVEFDSSLWESEKDFYNAFAENLKFPDYFGRNLDALNDCLSDIEIPFEGGLVIALANFDLFKVKFPDFAQGILEIISTNARYHLLFGKRLICLIHSNDPEILIDEVGAQPVIWNPREWMNKDRGL